MSQGKIGEPGPIQPRTTHSSRLASPGVNAFAHAPRARGSQATGDTLNRDPHAPAGDPLGNLLARATPAAAGSQSLGKAVGRARRKRGGGGRGRGGAHRGGAHRRALRHSPAARHQRQGAVRSSRAASGGNSHGTKAANFQQLTAKLNQLGITKADISKLAKENHVPERMVLGVMMQESGGDPKAGSKAGARGLMQLMPGTAKQLGVNINDPKQNLAGGVKYLGQMLKQFHGNETLALAAYNSGPGRVQKAGGVPQIKEMQHYVKVITGNMGSAQSAFDSWH